MKVTVRQTQIADVPALSALQARIIRIGGTTAHEVPFNDAEFARHYVTGPDVICSHVALLEGKPVGFQVVGRNAELPQGWGDIGTFVDPDIQRSGAGQALFAATCAAARLAGVATINATIRADNVPGLGYYAGRGFVDYAQEPDYALKSGAVVGRLHRKLDL